MTGKINKYEEEVESISAKRKNKAIFSKHYSQPHGSELSISGSGHSQVYICQQIR